MNAIFIAALYGIIDYKQYAHDPNYTISVLTKVLSMQKHKLPRKLRLQLDNCFKENKNKAVFTFLALLVEIHMFDEIIVGFLMVGHTHTDIDQVCVILSYLSFC